MSNDIHKVLMDFRNTIQLERDRLYKTRDPDITEVAQAHLKATKAIQNLIAQETNKARIEELKWFLGMADIGHGVRRLAQDKLDELTADKEEA